MENSAKTKTKEVDLPTTITHGILGLMTARTSCRRTMPAKFWLLSIICPILPDADILGLYLGISYGHFFGHRGFFHSLFFALLVSLFVVWQFFRDERFFSRRWWKYVFYFFIITASHCILDMFTNGGLGIAVLSPFDTSRYFAPWQPIQVSPIGGVSVLFTAMGVRALLTEIFWLWMPGSLLMCLILRIRKMHDSL